MESIVLIKNKKNEALPHIVRAGDLISFEPLEVTPAKVNIVWVDPPWGDKMMKFFFSQNKKFDNTRDITLWPYLQFMKSLLLKCASIMGQNSIMFLEYGREHKDVVTNLIAQSPLKQIGYRGVNYYGGGKWRGHDLHILSLKDSNTNDNLVPGESELINVGGFKMIIKCANGIVNEVRRKGTQNSDQTFFDPCCGLGLTAEAAIYFGARFIGNEFIPERAKRTKERIEKLQK